MRTDHSQRLASGIELRERLAALRASLDRAGCFAPAPWFLVRDITLVLLVYATAYAVLLMDPVPALRVAALLLLAFVSVQAGFVAHEAGHGAITRNRWGAALIGYVFNTLLTGLTYSHFQSIHRRHHAHTNEVGRDPDIAGKVFGLHAAAARAKRGLGAFITRRQSWMIWILVSLQGFSLKFDSVQEMWQEPRTTRLDQCVLLLHVALWFGLPVWVLGAGDALLNYLLMTWFVGPYLGAIFIVNHIGMRVIEPGESWTHMQRQLAVTRNLRGGPFNDFLFGGLNSHIEHHLFPTIPTARLGVARPLLREFCRRNDVPYHETSWLGATREVREHLLRMAALVPRRAERQGSA